METTHAARKGAGDLAQRLQNKVSGAGVCWRGAAEGLIRAGRVTVYGAPTFIGSRADPSLDRIEVDGRPVFAPEKKTYLMLNKPRGYVTTMSDGRGRPTVRELVDNCGARVYPVGRLDLNSEGLLILTDDGDAAKRLTHPSHEVDKEYLAWVTGDAEAALPALRKPMILDGLILRPAKVRRLEGHTEGAALLSITIHEGKNRQIRRMCEAAGLSVVRLRRIAVGKLELGDLPSGRWRCLTQEEIDYLAGI
jgi:23S rRNA pseudouridine2605 synthase